jgi:hypothetical protein
MFATNKSTRCFNTMIRCTVRSRYNYRYNKTKNPNLLPSLSSSSITNTNYRSFQIIANTSSSYDEDGKLNSKKYSSFGLVTNNWHSSLITSASAISISNANNNSSMKHPLLFRSFSTRTGSSNNDSNSHTSTTDNTLNTTDAATATASATDTSPINDEDDKTRKQKIVGAAKKGSKAVTKGALSIKDLIQKYGSTFISTYLTIYIITLSTLFVSLDSGFIDPTTLSHIELPWHSGKEAYEEDVADAKDVHSAIDVVANYMESWSWTAGYADYVRENPHTSNLAIAWVATKLTEPVRFGAVLFIVPKISKAMGKNIDDDDENIIENGNEKISNVKVGEVDKENGKETEKLSS